MGTSNPRVNILHELINESLSRILKYVGAKFLWIALVLQVYRDVTQILCSTLKKKYDFMTLIFQLVKDINSWIRETHEFQEN